MWHLFAYSSEDDHYCAAAECGLVVADDVIPFVTVACPAPSCQAPSNRGPCVMVLTDSGPVCTYCEENTGFPESLAYIFST